MAHHSMDGGDEARGQKRRRASTGPPRKKPRAAAAAAAAAVHAYAHGQPCLVQYKGRPEWHPAVIHKVHTPEAGTDASHAYDVKYTADGSVEREVLPECIEARPTVGGLAAGGRCEVNYNGTWNAASILAEGDRFVVGEAQHVYDVEYDNDEYEDEFDLAAELVRPLVTQARAQACPSAPAQHAPKAAAATYTAAHVGADGEDDEDECTVPVVGGGEGCKDVGKSTDQQENDGVARPVDEEDADAHEEDEDKDEDEEDEEDEGDDEEDDGGGKGGEDDSKLVVKSEDDSKLVVKSEGDSKLVAKSEGDIGYFVDDTGILLAQAAKLHKQHTQIENMRAKVAAAEDRRQQDAARQVQLVARALAAEKRVARLERTLDTERRARSAADAELHAELRRYKQLAIRLKPSGWPTAR